MTSITSTRPLDLPPYSSLFWNFEEVDRRGVRRLRQVVEVLDVLRRARGRRQRIGLPSSLRRRPATRPRATTRPARTAREQFSSRIPPRSDEVIGAGPYNPAGERRPRRGAWESSRSAAARRAPDPPHHAAARRDDGDLLDGAAARGRVSSLTFVLVTGVEGLLGLGPAIFLASSALAAMPAGRAMDRIGRKPVIAGGFAAAAVGCAITALAAEPRVGAAGHPRLRAHGRGERDRAADPHRGGRPLPARAARPRHLLRALRLRLRRHARAARVRAAVRRRGARRRRAHRAVARRRRDQPRRARPRARWCGPTRATSRG